VTGSTAGGDEPMGPRTAAGSMGSPSDTVLAQMLVFAALTVCDNDASGVPGASDRPH
jgi:hypothetical protein